MFNQYETIHMGHFAFRAKRSHPLMALRVEGGQSQGGSDGGSIRSSYGVRPGTDSGPGCCRPKCRCLGARCGSVRGCKGYKRTRTTPTLMASMFGFECEEEMEDTKKYLLLHGNYQLEQVSCRCAAISIQFTT